MQNVRIGARLVLGFGIMVILSLVLGTYSLDRQSAMQVITERLDRRDFASIEGIHALYRSEDDLRATRDYVLLSAYLRRDGFRSDEPQAVEAKWSRLRETNAKQLAELEASVAEWATTARTESRRAAWRRIRTSLTNARLAFNAIAPEVERQFALVNSGDLKGAANLRSETERTGSLYRVRLAEVQKAIAEQIELGRIEVGNVADETRSSVLLVLLSAVLAGVIFSFVIHRSITNPLHEFVAIVDRVGKGDLTQQVRGGQNNEIGDLGSSLATMVSGLKDVAGKTRLVAENLNTATAEIMASAQQQAASTAEQAAAVQQANATMAEISQSGAQISERARQVASTAAATSGVSTAGLQAVRNTVATIESIRQQAESVADRIVALSEKTQAISDIIASVDSIAEQSHLLALNAAIQAAAAGDRGRSFTVVANEMKNLAAQSRQATVQVRSILGEIQSGIDHSVMLSEEAVKRTESGRQQAGVAERTIRELTESVDESIRAFQQIVGGSSQQQIGFEQVTLAFRNIGIASQETATSTKQSEKAAANLIVLAQQLRTAVENYKV